MPEFSSKRLSAARMLRGLYQKELAEQLDISPQYMSFIERGERRPPDDLVQQMAFVLRFPVGFFYGSELELIEEDVPSFRARRSMTAKVRDAALAHGGVAVQIISPDINKRFKLPEVDVPDLSGHEPEVSAHMLREYWKLGDGPILNMVHLLESKGVEVYWLHEESPSVDAFSFWRDHQPFIHLNTSKDAGDRSRFDAAHELAHLVLHRDVEKIEGLEVEKEADRFAGAFLLPAEQFKKESPDHPDPEAFFKLKKRWKVAIAAMIYRCHEIGIFSEWQYQYAFRELSSRGWRTNEPIPIEREESHLHTLVFEKLADKGILPSEYARLLQIPSDELGELMPVASRYDPDNGVNSNGKHIREQPQKTDEQPKKTLGPLRLVQ